MDLPACATDPLHAVINILQRNQPDDIKSCQRVSYTVIKM